MSREPFECPSCALEVEDNPESCPYCGYEFPDRKRSVGAVAWLMALLLLLPVIWVLWRVL